MKIKQLLIGLFLTVFAVFAFFPFSEWSILNNIALADEAPSAVKAPTKFPTINLAGKPSSTDTAVHNPDQYAWELFAAVNQNVPDQFQATSKDGNKTNNVLWETWADDPLTFPAKPDPANPPQWPGEKPPVKSLRQRSKVEASQPQFLQFQDSAIKDCKAENNKNTKAQPAPTCEEVRRNYATFDYIIKNNLWYTEGLAAFFDTANAKFLTGEKVQKIVDFPKGSIEVKGNWVPITEEQKKDFHWNYDENGELYGLIAMHISSKILPTWFWTTFEWEGNYGRCDYIGCHDQFGVTPTDVLPNSTINQKYEKGTLTSNLINLFKEKGLNKEFKHYRLKGAQIAFTDSTGKPNLLGNSVTESGFVPTASCIGCHARAAIRPNGKSAFPVAGFRPSIIGTGQTGNTAKIGNVEVQLPNGPLVQSYNGTPDPNWYYRIISDQGTLPEKLQSDLILDNLQMDFVWAIPINVKSVNSGE